MLLFFGSLVFNLEIEAFLERLKALLLSSGARSLLSKLGLSGGLAGLALRALITISGVASDRVGPHDALWVGFGHKASPAGNGLFPSVLPRELQFRRLGWADSSFGEVSSAGERHGVANTPGQQPAATLPVGQPAAHPVAEQPVPAQEPEPANTSLGAQEARPAGEDGGSANAAPPTSDQVKESLRAFLNQFRKRKVNDSFLNNAARDLDLERATPEKLQKLLSIMEELSNDSRRRPNSGQNAAAQLELYMDIIDWEKKAASGSNHS